MLLRILFQVCLQCCKTFFDCKKNIVKFDIILTPVILFWFLLILLSKNMQFHTSPEDGGIALTTRGG